MQAIQDLKQEIQRDLTGIVPAGRLVPNDVAKNLQDTLDIVDGIEERVVVLEEAPEPETGVPDTGPETRVISGGKVAWDDNGYEFIVSECNYKIHGFEYTAPQTTLTLSAADFSQNRIDLILARDNGLIQYRQGGYSAGTPTKPYVDTTGEIVLAVIYVEANTSAPQGSLAVYAFDENTGTPDEYDFSSYSPNITVDDLVDQAVGGGQYAINFANPDEGVWIADLWGPNNFTLGNNTSLLLNIKSRGALTSGEDGKKLILFLIDGDEGNGVGSSVAIKDGSYGFDSSNTTDWQQLVIPLSDFGLGAGALVGAIGFTIQGTEGELNAYVDYIYFTNFDTGIANNETEFEIKIIDADVPDTDARNTIQELSNGERWAVDKHGRSTQLNPGSGGAAEVTLYDETAQGVNDTYVPIPGLDIVVPAKKIVEFDLFLYFDGASTDTRLKTIFEVTAGDITFLSPITQIALFHYAATAQIERTHAYYGDWATEVDWDAMTGWPNSSTLVMKVKGTYANNHATDDITTRIKFKAFEGYATAIFRSVRCFGRYKTIATLP